MSLRLDKQTDSSQREAQLVMVGVLMVMLLASLDQTIVATAIPHIVAALQGFDRSRLKQTPRASFELRSGLDQQTLQFFRQFHAFPPNSCCLAYTTCSWILYSF
jgi:hypothetical protein